MNLSTPFSIEKSKKSILNIAIVILALIISVNIYKGQVKDVTDLIQRRESSLKNNVLLQEISQLEKKIDSYKTAINNKDMSAIINTLNTIAGNSGVELVSIRPKPAEDYPVYVKYGFTLNITTKRYHDLAKFISQVENSSDIYVIERFGVGITIDADKNKGLAAELILNTVLFKG